MKMYIYLKNIRKIKINIIESLYQYDFYQNEIKTLNENILLNVSILKNIIKNIGIIDFIIKKNLYNYELKRLNKVDKAIIRLATMELLAKKKSYKKIINEAIELTKEYSSLEDKKQCKFNNKLLHLIYEYINKKNLKKLNSV
ncbi:nusB family protein [Candidatus Phytoplasma oryzae]|uniref:NusB family protein n=1 Tax=Candidatus Phytoplasma oryzae TaxID=203274 RepID=A0A139JQF9_9MOLU|nr:transcription antitermination factor NusB [Candidatus Phytoplasma oryzae]KXT29116.1 nusB family protein [Candidatus Phytoplasma oryzae]RAM57812.1 transcription termination factor NusB [Candidatus Phytoplasma oryzae]